MKKIFFMAISAVILAAGCQKTEIQNEVLPKIGFDTRVGKLTKADPDAENSGQSANLEAQGFMVWGYFATEGDLNFDKYELYLGNKDKDGKEQGIEVIFDEGWNTKDAVYYWPGKRKELDLYAVSLWSAQSGEVVNSYSKVSITQSDQTLQVSDFFVNNAADDDLMVAPLIRQDQDDAEVVQPQFQHALAKVLVKFTTTATPEEEDMPTGVYVKSVSLQNVLNSGTLTVKNELAANQESGPTKYDAGLGWAQGTSKATYTAVYKPSFNNNIPFAEVTNVKDNSKDSTIDKIENVVPLTGSPITFGSWLLIPQPLTEDVKLVVEYIVDGIFSTTTFDLATYSTKEWEKGMQITYNVSIAPEYITFAPEVKEWVNDYPEDRGDYDYNSVEVTYSEAVDGQEGTKSVTLYFVDTLVVGSKVFVKENDTYRAAPNNVYTITADDGKTTLLTVASGRITKKEVNTPAAE